MIKVNKTLVQTEENKARAIVYNLLSSLFAKEINKELVAQLRSEQGQSFLNSLALEPTLAPSINEINARFAQLDSEESLLELAADFCGLFLVDGKTSVSPYAGQYLDCEPSKEKTSLFGEYHQEMTELLISCDLQIHSDFPEPSDHIAVILAYVAHLCTSTSPLHQLNFIDTYLMPWLSSFNEQVKKHDPSGLYTAITELTLEWLKMDTIHLSRD